MNTSIFSLFIFLSCSFLIGAEKEEFSFAKNFIPDDEVQKAPYSWDQDAIIFGRNNLEKFFKFSTIEDKDIHKFFLKLYNDLLESRNNEEKVVDTLRNNLGPMGQHLRAHPALSKLKESIHTEIKLVVEKELPQHSPLDTRNERAALSILLKLQLAENALDYLVPIVSKVENYVEILMGKKAAHDKGLSFLFLYVVGPLIVEAVPDSRPAALIANILIAMIADKKESVGNSDFFHKKTSWSKMAFEIMNDLRKTLSTKPALDSQFQSEILTIHKFPGLTSKSEIKSHLREKYSLPEDLAKHIASLTFKTLNNRSARQDLSGRSRTF